MKKQFIIFFLCSAILLNGCGSTTTDKNSKEIQTETTQKNKSVQSESKSTDLYAMDTYMTLTAYGKNADRALTVAKQKIEDLDALLSTGNKKSEIYKLNQTGKATLSDTSAFLLEKSIEINKKTDGAFDPAIYPLMELWGFTTKKYYVPKKKEIKDLLPLTKVGNIQFDSSTRKISFGVKGMKLDFGGIAKGYTSSEVMKVMKENGVESAMVSLGGNVQLLGKKPDGSNWRVAVENPNEEEDYLGIIEASDKAIITSGGYERYFTRNGKTYHHIIDPKTGCPAKSDLTSVTIISSDGTLADGYSTSLFVMGLKDAIQFWRAHADEFDAVLYTKDGKLYVTEGIKNSFTSDFKWSVIEKKENK